MGYYDESLSLTRSIGDIGNLLLLFNQDTIAFEEWQQSSKRQRRSQFSPVKVRCRLEAIGRTKSVDLTLLMMDEWRYGALSEVATHATPQTKPQVHNPREIPCSGGVFQEAGVVVALQELAAATARAAIPLPKLLGYDNQRRDEIREATAVLLSSSGRLNVLTEKQFFADMGQADDIPRHRRRNERHGRPPLAPVAPHQPRAARDATDRNERAGRHGREERDGGKHK
jgi:hypothetical protein